MIISAHNPERGTAQADATLEGLRQRRDLLLLLLKGEVGPEAPIAPPEPAAAAPVGAVGLEPLSEPAPSAGSPPL